MRIDRLIVKNFKKFSEQTFSLHPKFTLLVGENGSGKTSILDALAISMAVWLVEPPGRNLHNSRRNILPKEIRLELSREGDRIQFREKTPVVIEAHGCIAGIEDVSWTRQIRKTGGKTVNTEARRALEIVKRIYNRIDEDDKVVCPVLAYYGAGRAWLPSNQRLPKNKNPHGPSLRWDAFYDCFNERIRFDELREWFSRETTVAGTRGGRMRPGFEAVRLAILGCVPGASDIKFDIDRNDIVLSINENTQPFSNLSAGQQMMLALVADIAIKAVTQNAHLLPADKLDGDEKTLPRILKETPGIVLIDELDVHLHPRWQRRVATDLKRTFPSIQFVCTSHSPQVIGEVSTEEILLLSEEGAGHPAVARGADANWILDHVMSGTSSSADAMKLQDEIEDSLDEGDIAKAKAKLEQLRSVLEGRDTGTFVRLESNVHSLEALQDSSDDVEDS
ncbi:MAG: AAA family ATPase [Planctomycetes bacterium]|nr:AAA family ATPase [Planctomycetota bacterium]